MANRDTALSREQHAFLQALMAKGAMPEKSAKRLYTEIASMDPAEANKTFSRFWNPIASALGYLDLDIRVIRYQEDQQLYIGVVNKTGGEAAKLATRLTPEQIALFRVVLDEIMRDDGTVERGVDVITALNATQVAPTQVRRRVTNEPSCSKPWHPSIRRPGGWTKPRHPDSPSVRSVEPRTDQTTYPSSVRRFSQGETQGDGGLSQAQTQSVAKMSKMEKEATLKQLCKDGWLTQADDEAGFLKLGVRAFLELKEFLLEQAPERARAKWERML